MSITQLKLTDAAIAQKGVVAAPDKLTGTAAENKAVFDRLIREAVKGLFNGLIDELSGAGGAGEIGAAAVPGIAGNTVQTALEGIKAFVDANSETKTDAAAALALKSDKADTDRHYKSVAFNASTGVFTFTREDGSFTAVDTLLEKVATNWRYDPDAQSLVLTLADGSTQTVPLSAFITETEFADSAQIAFSVAGHTVTATVKSGSITDAMLSSALAERLRSYAGGAASASDDASRAAALAESWAVGGTGTRAGEDTDNAGYWAAVAMQQADRASVPPVAGVYNLVVSDRVTGDKYALVVLGGRLTLLACSAAADTADLQLADVETGIVYTLTAENGRIVLEEV